MKKIFAINLVIILLLSLSACDSSTETSTAQQSASPSSDVTEAPVTEQLAGRAQRPVRQPPAVPGAAQPRWYKDEFPCTAGWRHESLGG